MFKVETDVARRLLRLTYSQRVAPAQARQCRVAVAAALAKLQPGFRVLTDLRNLEEMDTACAAELQAIMDLCRKKGVSEVVRVIPDTTKDIGFNLMSFFHYGHDLPILTFETLAEAQQKLSA